MSIRKKLILTLLIIAVVPMLFVGTLGYFSAKQALEDAKISALSGICDLKVKKLEAFIIDRKKEIAFLKAYPGINDIIGALAQKPSVDPAPLDGLLNSLQEAYHFTNAVIATVDGQINYAMTGSHSAEYTQPYLPDLTVETKTPKTDGTRISDVFINGRLNSQMAILVTSPIYRPDNTLAGWLGLEYDIAPIFDSIQDNTGLGQTGETLIAKRVGQSALFLNPLRFDPGASLKRKIEIGDRHGLPIQAALNGKNGHGFAADYRSQPVIAAWRFIPSLGWGMVTKIDVAEAFEPIHRLRTFFLILMVVVIILSICVAVIVARSFSRPILELQESVVEIGKGNLDHKVGSVAKDEIGQLGNAFDQMTEKLRVITASREELNREISQRKQVEENLKRTITNLDERVKELNCFFGISRLVEKHDQSLESILQGIVDLIPNAMRYQDIACAKLTLNGQEFKTKYFKTSPWQHVCNINVTGMPAGQLIVAYLEKMSAKHEDPFIKEEHDLLEAISERVGKIIEHRNARDGLKESENRFRELVENSLTGISIVQNNQVIYQNKEQERILGPLPRPFILVDFEKIHPDDVTMVKRLNQRLEMNVIQSTEADFRYFTGKDKNNSSEMIWVNCRAILIEYQGRPAYLINIVDMTNAKELEKRLTMQDKMASLGRVAAGIAHEIRNPLSGINIYLDTLKKLHHKDGSEYKVDNILRQLIAASHKIESVIRRVMDFAKPSEPKLALIDINEPIGEAIGLTAVTMRKSGVLLTKSLAGDLPPVYADRHLIEEMVLNLINNAAEAMRAQEADKIIEVGTALEEEGITVSIADSGPGIPLEIRDKIFDPYLTTKSDGTGIGLSLCHRIVTDHGGFLIVGDSELGGVEFRATIPIRKGQ